MADLLLVDTATGAVEARLALAPDGTVTVTGDSAEIGRAILSGQMRLREVGEAEVFAALRDFGWSNGPLALVDADRTADLPLGAR